jgi:hypothetical protein
VIARSNPIIEHCSGLKFGTPTFSYAKREEHIIECALNGNNMWNQVLDFNWHKKDKSPNWDPLSEEEINSVAPVIIEI